MTQSSQYMKLRNKTYIQQIIQDKKFLNENLHNLPLSMSNISIYNKQIEVSKPLDPQNLRPIGNIF